MHRLIMTFEKVMWEEDSEDPIIDTGYYEPSWGEWSDFKDLDSGEWWDKKEIGDRRTASMVDIEPDEWDIEDGISLAMKTADFIEEWGCDLEADHDCFRGEAHIPNYSEPWDRTFTIHLVEGDWSDIEIQAIHEELQYREFMRSLKRQENTQSYWNSVKAYV